MADIIKSTSQAILFEQFNDKAPSLNTMLDTTEEEKVETADFALRKNRAYKEYFLSSGKR